MIYYLSLLIPQFQEGYIPKEFKIDISTVSLGALIVVRSVFERNSIPVLIEFLIEFLQLVKWRFVCKRYSRAARRNLLRAR